MKIIQKRTLSQWALLFAMITPVWAAELLITNPGADRAYQRPAQSIDIEVQSGDFGNNREYALLVFFDDKPVAVNENSVSLASADYTPGEHIIRAEIQDSRGRAVVQDKRRVYLIQNTALIRKKREEAQKKAAYDALPWYKKDTAISYNPNQ